MDTIIEETLDTELHDRQERAIQDGGMNSISSDHESKWFCY